MFKLAGSIENFCCRSNFRAAFLRPPLMPVPDATGSFSSGSLGHTDPFSGVESQFAHVEHSLLVQSQEAYLSACAPLVYQAPKTALNFKAFLKGFFTVVIMWSLFLKSLQ